MAVGALECRRPTRTARASCCSGPSAPSAGTATSRIGAAPSRSRSQGRYRDDSLLLSQRGLNLTFSFGDVPLRRFDLRMQMGADRRARGASLTAEVFCPEVPVYGPALVAIGLCNSDPILPSSGTFITGPYRGPANSRPRGVRLESLELSRPAGARRRGRRPPGGRAAAAPTATRLPSSSRTPPAERWCRSITARRFH